MNPAGLIGAKRVEPIFPSAPFAPGTLIAAGTALLHLTQPMPPTVWSASPVPTRRGARPSTGARVLELTALHGAQVPTPSPTRPWGLHLLDANIELGDLLTLVRREAAAYARS